MHEEINTENQLLVKINTLSIENSMLKSKIKELMAKNELNTNNNKKVNETLLKFNQFSTDLAYLQYQEVFPYIIKHIKDFFDLKAAWITNFDEATSDLVIQYSSLSIDLSSKIARLLGRKVINLRTHITQEQYHTIVSESYRELSSLYELTFGSIPEMITKAAEKTLGIDWIIATALMHKQKLLGTLIMVGNSGQKTPAKEEIQTLVNILSNAIGRKKAEMELNSVKNKNAALQLAIPDLMLIQDKKGIFIDCRIPEAFTHIASPQTFIGKSISDVYNKEQLKLLKPIFQTAIQTKQIQVIEYAEQIEGKKHFFEARIIANDDNILSLIKDISEQKHIEQALRQSEEKYRTMVQYSSDPIFSFNPDETYRFVNDVFAKTFGKSPEDLIGKTPHSIFPFQEAEKRLMLVRKVFKSGIKGEIEVKVIGVDGNEYYFMTVADPIKDEKGEILWVSCISKNITERKLSEIKIKQQNEQLIQLNKTKDKFFSIIAHDLKNPFNSLLGLSELLLTEFEYFERDKIKEIISVFANTSNHTYKLLENLLEWANIQQGNLKPNLQKQDLKIIIAELEQLNAEMTKSKSIKFINNIKNSVFVHCDIDMTKTILRHLISNAIKFNKMDGKISISTYCTNSEVIVTVKDNGVGIEPEKTKLLFHIDKNNSTRGTMGEPGTGLGLLLCKEMVEMQEGKIWIESEIDKGSSFSFSLKKHQSTDSEFESLN